MGCARGLSEVALAAFYLAGAAACGSGGSSGAPGVGTGSNRGSEAGLAPPNFEFVPRPPGRAVGVRAIVDVDGVELTTDPLELVLFAEPSGSGRAGALRRALQSAPDPLGRASQPQTSCPRVGDVVGSLQTVNGNACFLVQSLSSGGLGASESLSRAYVFGREGIYEHLEVAASVYVPPDIANYGLTFSFGCVSADEGQTLTYAYFDELANLSFTFGLLFYQVGYTFFTSESQRRIVRGFQYDTGVGFSVGLFPVLAPVPINIGMSLEQESRGLRDGFKVVLPYNGPEACSPDNYEPGNPFEFARDRLAALQQSREQTLEAELGRQMAASAGPLLEALGDSGHGGLADNVPAASTGDQLDDYLDSSSTEVGEGDPNTSLDGITQAFQDRLLAAGDDTRAILAGAGETVAQVNRSVPSLTGQAVLLQEAGVALQAGAELSQLADVRATGAQSYISNRVERIVVPAGEPVKLEITAQEIADLIQRPVADVEGATVIVNAGTGIVDEPFVLEGAGLSLEFEINRNNLLVRTDVDLSTAAGNFPPDVADWVVRPALRVIEIEAGPAARAFISGPSRLPSGGPASLTVQVTDDTGRVVKRPFGVRFVDAEGNSIGTAESERSSALFQYVPVPSEPKLLLVTQTTITVGGQSRAGVVVAGTGFSRDAQVSVDGTELVVDRDFQVKDPEGILVVLTNTAAGTHTLSVRNPEGTVTDSLEFEFAP